MYNEEVDDADLRTSLEPLGCLLVVAVLYGLTAQAQKDLAALEARDH